MAQSNSLSATKGRALEKIDESASHVRRSRLTPGFGQDLVYQAKLEQAKKYLSTPIINALTPVPPYIVAEASAWGIPAHRFCRICRPCTDTTVRCCH